MCRLHFSWYFIHFGSLYQRFWGLYTLRDSSLSVVSCNMDKLEQDLSQYDFVQFTVPDMHGIPRGRLVPKDKLTQACHTGVDIFSGVQCFGIQTEVATQLPDFENLPNGCMRPIAGTARPLAWCSSPQKRMGHVLCQLEFKGKGALSESCPRLAAIRQVEKLQKRGLRIKAAFECEFEILHADSLKPLGGTTLQYGNFDLLDRNLDVLTDMLDELRNSGIPLEYFFPEYDGGQFEATIDPLFGVGAADAAFMLRYGVRAFCGRRNLTATFMARPLADFHSAGFHFNHSLWQENDSNAFLDPSNPVKLSQLGRHWVAGLLEHAPALTALCCPTVNCYRRLRAGFAPGPIFWNLDDRLCTIRLKNADANVFLENRLPSSACNPYLVQAGTIAAGLDGIERQLQCPELGAKDERLVPASLEEALDALDKDQVLKEAVGAKLVDYFMALKRDFEVKTLKQLCTKDMSTAEQVAREQEIYMPVL